MKTAYTYMLVKADKIQSATAALEYCLGERRDVESKIKKLELELEDINESVYRCAETLDNYLKGEFDATDSGE